MADSRRAWARALFVAAGSGGARSALGEALDGLSLALDSPGILELLEDPALPKRRRIAFLEAALAPGAEAQAKEVFGRFSALLVDKGRIGLIRAIAGVFREMVDTEEGICRLEIEAALEPEPDAVRRLSSAWSEAGRGERVLARVRIQPALIGGYRLRSGSVRYDYSIAGRAERLRRHLARPIGPERGQG